MKTFSLIGGLLFAAFLLSVIFNDAECFDIKPVLKFDISNFPGLGRFAHIRCNSNITTNFTKLYQFYKDDVEITENETLSYMLINPLLTGDTGNYSCLVKINGTTTSSIKVEIKVPLITVIKGYEVIEGQDLNLMCTEEKGDVLSSSYHITWKAAGAVLANETSPVLTIRNISRNYNQRAYSCIATNTNGEPSNEASQELAVYWIDPPILKLSYDYLWQGSTVMQLFCQRMAYEPHQTNRLYLWFKDGEQVELESTEFFYLRNISQSDAANYTCAYTSMNVTKTSKTKPFIVLYMDEAQIRFLDNTSSTVAEGGMTFFSCRVDTYYPGLSLTYSWYKNAKLLSHQAEYRINTTTRSDGYLDYDCKVTGRFNDSKLTREASVKLSIHYPPKGFISPIATEIKLINSSYNRACSANDFGNPKATMYLYRNGADQPFRNGTQGQSLSLVLNPLGVGDAGNYTCTAINYLGKISYTHELVVAVPPGPPKQVEVLIVSQWRIRLRWLPPDFLGTPHLRKYHVQFVRKEKGWVDQEYRQTNYTSLNIWSLRNGTEYLFRVVALNDYGKSEPSDQIEAVTVASIPPFAPTNFKQVLPRLHREVMVQWKQPSGTAPIYTYYISYNSHRQPVKAYGQFAINRNASLVAINHTITGLDIYTGYNVTLQTSNIYGDSPEVMLYNVFTSEGEPEAVQDVMALSYQTYMVLRWKAPVNINGEFQRYSVCHEIAESGLNYACINTTNTVYNLTGLQRNHLYVVNITAHNNKFSKTLSIKKRTRGTAPPPLESTLPEPTAAKISSSSFAINIVLFNETNGEIGHYDVIAIPDVTDAAMLNKAPNSYSNQEIFNHVVGRLVNPSSNQDFIVGSGFTGGRKKRALGTPHNPPLKENTVYAVFVRAYVTDSEYQSTPWYKQVKTKKADSDDDDDDGLTDGETAAIVIGVIIGICIIVIILFLLFKPKKSKSANLNMKEFHGK